MQSNQFKSVSENSNLTLNPVTLGSDSIQNNLSVQILDPYDPAYKDSLSSVYIAPDSVIVFGANPEWSQFRGAYKPVFNYQSHFRPVPLDSLHTVLKGVEVVFPGRKILRNNPDWLIGILLVCFLLFATVRLIFNKYLSQLMQSTINYSTFTRLLRERYFNFFHASFRLDIISNTILALFFYQFLAAYKINFGYSNSFYVFLTCLGIVIGYFTVKRILYYLIGILTESRQEIQEYLFNIKVFNRVLGLFLLPICGVVAFIPLSQIEPVLYAGAFVVLVFYLMTLLRGAKIFLKKQFSISYLILYLCTLEFLPLVLLYSLLPI